MSTKLTAETIIDEQIHALWVCPETRKIYPHAGEVRNMHEFRTRCAEIINARGAK